MLLIDAVNRVLRKISESPVNSIDSTNVAVLCTQAVKDSFASIVSEATWAWSERVVSPQAWTANHAALLDDNVTDIKKAFCGTRLLRYATTEQLLRMHTWNGEPCYYGFIGKEIHFRPMPDLETHKLKIKFLAHYLEPILHGDDQEVPIPKELEYLLVLKAAATMSVDHLQSSDMNQLYLNEYFTLLNQAKPRKNTNYSQSAIA